MSLAWTSNGPARMRVVSASVLLGLLMGCSDGRSAFDGLAEEADRIAGEIRSLDPASTEDLPVTGLAGYEGVMTVETAGRTLAGAMEMEVDFGDARDPLSGGVTNIVGEGLGRFDGTLSISDSRLDREGTLESGPIFSADLGGTLEDPDGVELDVDTFMEGSFAGSASDAISHAGGFARGDACSVEGCVDFDGGFVLER